MFALRNLSKLKTVTKPITPQTKFNTTRNGHNYNYRVGPPPPNKKLVFIAEICQGFAWWWVLWHLWTEGSEITGIFEYADPSKWTDDELGIPEGLKPKPIRKCEVKKT